MVTYPSHSKLFHCLQGLGNISTRPKNTFLHTVCQWHKWSPIQFSKRRVYCNGIKELQCSNHIHDVFSLGPIPFHTHIPSAEWCSPNREKDMGKKIIQLIAHACLYHKLKQHHWIYIYLEITLWKAKCFETIANETSNSSFLPLGSYSWSAAH